MSQEKVLLKRDKDRILDSFYVTFLRLPLNSSNVFGRQLISISRPDVTFDISETAQKAALIKDISKPTFGSCSMVFHDDEDSVLLSLIYQQIFRQVHKNNQNKQTHDDVSFDIHIDLMNSNDVITSEMTLLRCHISSVSFDELSYASDETSTISVEVSVENIDLKVNEEFVNQIEMKPATGIFTTQPKPVIKNFDH